MSKPGPKQNQEEQEIGVAVAAVTPQFKARQKRTLSNPHFRVQATEDQIQQANENALTDGMGSPQNSPRKNTA